MRKSIIFVISSFLSTATLANNYELAPATTQFNANANTSVLKEISRAREKLAESTMKGVVFISVSKTVNGQQFIDPFEFFFGEPMGPQRRQQQPRQEGFGSGFFVDLDKGYILTNNHVVESADKISVKVANGKSYDAKIVGHDKDTDVAVIQIVDKNFSRENLTALVLGDSDSVAIGSDVLALGAPFLLEGSITAGIVSAVGRGNLQLTKMGNFIQTDAAINPGNSGGPLINMDGKVIAINSAIFSQSGAYAGIGFSIPSNIVRRIANSLINKGSFYKGYVGIAYEPLREDWIASLGLPKGTKGIIIADVVAGGPAANAHLETGDVVVAVDGSAFVPENLTSVIGLKEPGTSLRLTVYRQGKKLEIDVKVGTAPEQRQTRVAGANAPKSGTAANTNKDIQRFGFALAPIDDKLRAQFELLETNGLVIIYIEPVSVAWRQGFREGDVIVGVNGKAVRSVDAFVKETQGKDHVLLHIKRKGRSIFETLKSEQK